MGAATACKEIITCREITALREMSATYFEIAVGDFIT
jgi:hypothetical protein